MSEPGAKRQPIDLDEFDRRLRAPAAQRRDPGRDSGQDPGQDPGEDPLAELARLVSRSPDPFAPLFAAGRPNSRAAQPAVAPPPSQDLRSGYDETEGQWPQASAPPADSAGHSARENWGRPDALARLPAAPRRPRGSVLLMSAALAVVFGGVAATLALRGHVVRFGSPPTILADARPYKVKPPSQPAKDQIENATTLLDKDGVGATRPVHIVNTEEEPLDLALAASPKNPPSAASGDTGGAFSVFPTPRPVKTVLVRPDGTIISQDDSAADPGPAEVAAAPSSGATSPSGSPPAAAPSADSSSTSSTATGSTANAGSADAAQANSTPPSAAQAPSFANVVDQAAANSQASAPPPVEDSPARPAPAVAAPVPAAPAKNVQSADLSEDNAPASAAAASSGNWAVQVAAPATEREAHTEILRLQRRFAAALDGRKLISYSAQSNGRTVWRVRVAGLSREAAGALCGKIKGDGGACFVARN